MDSYNFWQDFFDTYQSLPDWMKALWLIVPPAFILGLVALVVRFRIDRNKGGKLVYSVYRDEVNQLHIVSHDREVKNSVAANTATTAWQTKRT